MSSVRVFPTSSGTVSEKIHAVKFSKCHLWSLGDHNHFGVAAKILDTDIYKPQEIKQVT